MLRDALRNAQDQLDSVQQIRPDLLNAHHTTSGTSAVIASSILPAASGGLKKFHQPCLVSSCSRFSVGVVRNKDSRCNCTSLLHAFRNARKDRSIQMSLASFLRICSTNNLC